MTDILDPLQVAATFREELRTQLASLAEPLHLVGILTADHGPSHTYASYTERACTELGIRFEMRQCSRLTAEAAIEQANADASVHGIMVYYPIFGGEHDMYLRDRVELLKDIEGLHSSWARRLYENRRYLDAAKTKKAILPCTPLAILKLVAAAGYFARAGRPLEGRTVSIFNRSEVVGRPLASMMAHDGARVYSFDIDGALSFQSGPQPDSSHVVSETNIDRAAALAQSDIVITGVPSKQFELIKARELQPSALCLNFSTYKNFDPDIVGKVACFVPRVGPMTVLMAIRNALRLYQHARDARG
jgi:methylenetetrahydrofolate dehydrogenase (NADP+)/methenyltetrahydrofolate cyclohydrolase